MLGSSKDQPCFNWCAERGRDGKADMLEKQKWESSCVERDQQRPGDRDQVTERWKDKDTVRKKTGDREREA